MIWAQSLWLIGFALFISILAAAAGAGIEMDKWIKALKKRDLVYHDPKTAKLLWKSDNTETP